MSYYCMKANKPCSAATELGGCTKTACSEQYSSFICIPKMLGRLQAQEMHSKFRALLEANMKIKGSYVKLEGEEVQVIPFEFEGSKKECEDYVLEIRKAGGQDIRYRFV